MSATSVTTQSDRYLLGHEERELERLRRQADFFAPLTRQAIQLAGIQPGMRVLDAGCGAGDVSMLLAQQVGPTGQVVSIDRAEEAVTATRTRMANHGFAHVQVLQADVATVQLGQPVDAVVGRLILMHVADPVAVVRNLRSNLAPGGIILFQELDIAIARGEPSSPLLDEMIALCRNTFVRAGVDDRPGLRLHDQLSAAGLPAPQLISLGRIEAPPAAASAALLAGVLTTLLPAIEATGLGAADQLQLETLPQRLQADALATGSLIFTPNLITAWSRID